MKVLGWLAAAVLAVTGIAAAAPAQAQPERVRVVERTRIHYESDRRWDRGRHYGRAKWRWRTVCRNRYRYGHRERVCRRIRYRR